MIRSFIRTLLRTRPCAEWLSGYGTKGTNSIVATKGYERNDSEEMETGGKRTVQVNVKMSTEDFSTLQRAANALWPDAILSNSGIILGLAKLAAKDILKEEARQTSPVGKPRRTHAPPTRPSLVTSGPARPPHSLARGPRPNPNPKPNPNPGSCVVGGVAKSPQCVIPRQRRMAWSERGETRARTRDTRNCPARSGNFGKDVLVLAIAYDQHPLAGAFSHHEFEPAMGGIDRDERGRTVVIRPRRHRAFPLAEIECGHSVLVQHGQLTEFLAGIPLCQT